MKRFLTLLITLTSALPGFALERAFWVNPRETKITSMEMEELQKLGVTTLYWRWGTMGNINGAWQWDRQPVWPQQNLEAIRVVPTVFLDTKSLRPFPKQAGEALAQKLAEKFAKTQADELHLDFACPESALAEYAASLKLLRKKVPRISITALPSWISSPHFPALCDAVDEMIPRFGAPDEDTLDALQPALSIERVAEQLAAWEACKTPWRGGFSLITRITSYDRITNRPRENLRFWRWSDIVYQSGLKVVEESPNGITKLVSQQATKIQQMELAQDDFAVVRRPSLQAIAGAEKLLGKRCAVYDRLPDSSDDVSWSLRQLAHPESAEPPKLTLKAGSGLSLINESSTDLPPKLNGGYVLQIDAPAAAFGNAREGDFVKMKSWGKPRYTRESDRSESSGYEVPVTLAWRLAFYFTHLPAGKALQVRPWEMGPDGKLSDLRFRILHAEGNEEWMPVR